MDRRSVNRLFAKSVFSEHGLQKPLNAISGIVVVHGPHCKMTFLCDCLSDVAHEIESEVKGNVFLLL